MWLHLNLGFNLKTGGDVFGWSMLFSKNLQSKSYIITPEDTPKFVGIFVVSMLIEKSVQLL